MDIIGKAQALLQGEPLRAIVYGAAVVVWLVTHIASALGVGPWQGQTVDLDTALLMATGASVALTEFARRWTFSPATVAKLVSPTAKTAKKVTVLPAEGTTAVVVEAKGDGG